MLTLLRSPEINSLVNFQTDDLEPQLHQGRVADDEKRGSFWRALQNFSIRHNQNVSHSVMLLRNDAFRGLCLCCSLRNGCQKHRVVPWTVFSDNRETFVRAQLGPVCEDKKTTNAYCGEKQISLESLGKQDGLFWASVDFLFFNSK